VLRALSEPIKAGFRQFDLVRLCAGKFRENPECRSTLWNKGGVDGRTREARIKAGRSRKVLANKKT
jgi:hypothetical protein